MDPIERIRQICMALPEAEERPMGGHARPAWRVRDKMFVKMGEFEDYLEMKAGPGVQEMLVASDPKVYSVPKYVGTRGWINARFDGDVDWDELTDLIRSSYKLIAPKRLAAQADA